MIADAYLDLSVQYTTILEDLDEKELNTVPFEGSWTAAQVIQRHLHQLKKIHKVLKSN